MRGKKNPQSLEVCSLEVELILTLHGFLYMRLFSARRQLCPSSACLHEKQWKSSGENAFCVNDLVTVLTSSGLNWID